MPMTIIEHNMEGYRIRIEKLDSSRNVVVQAQVEIPQEAIEVVNLSEEDILKIYFQHLYIRLKEQGE